MHRLDRDTSGCLLIARKRSALRTLHALLRDGQVEKRYLALVKGKWELGHKRIDVPLRTDIRVGGERTVKAHESGKEAVSDFRPVQFFGKRATLVEVALDTGRTHQIRVHAAHAGYPVAGDEKYGDEEFNEEMKALGLKRMFLHAHSVSFDWPRERRGVQRERAAARGSGRGHRWLQSERARERRVNAVWRDQGTAKPDCAQRAREPDERQPDRSPSGPRCRCARTARSQALRP